MMRGPVATVYIPLAWADGGVEAGLSCCRGQRDLLPLGEAIIVERDTIRCRQ